MVRGDLDRAGEFLTSYYTGLAGIGPAGEHAAFYGHGEGLFGLVTMH